MKVTDILSEQALAMETAIQKHMYKCDDADVEESGPASRKLCTSARADHELGISQLNSCKAQGLRARQGKQAYRIGKKKVKVKGKKIRGPDYGGPIPKWSQ